MPGDSLRINPAGPVRDLYGNAANALNPAVAITLKQIPPGIITAYYVDRDASGAADGYIDTAIIQFNKKVALSDLSFQLDWGVGFDVTGITGDTVSYASSDSTRVAIALRLVFPYTGLLKTSGAMFVTASFGSFPGETRQAQVADSAAPVIDSATYYVNPVGRRRVRHPGVLFSEPVNINQALNPFLLSGKTAASYAFPFPRSPYRETAPYTALPGRGSRGLPQNGDMIWIAPDTGVSDLGGVFQDNGNNRKVGACHRQAQNRLEAFHCL